jgi:hypothetical protein
MFLRQLFIDLDQLNIDYDKSKEKNSLKGILDNILGIFFSFYCIYKVITVIIE